MQAKHTAGLALVGVLVFGLAAWLLRTTHGRELALQPRARPLPAASPAAGSLTLPAARDRARDSLPGPAVDEPRVVRTPRQARAEREDAPPKHRVLRGTVFGVDGEPAPGGTVRAVDRLARTRYGRVDAGRYEIEDLDRGRYWVRANVRGREVEREVVIEELETTLDLAVPLARMLDIFVVAADGESVHALDRASSSLAVVITSTYPGDHYGGEGLARVTIPGLNFPPNPWGEVAFDHHGPVHASLLLNDRPLVTQLVEGGETKVTLVLDTDLVRETTCSLRARVVDGESGEPVHRAALWFASHGSFAGADGRVTLEDCPPGRGPLRVEHSGFIPLEMDVELLPGEENELGKLTLARSSFVAGLLSGADGSQSIKVRARPYPPVGEAPSAPGRAFQYRPAVWKRFRLDVAPGMYVLHASDDRGRSRSRNHLVDATRKPVEGILLELLPTHAVVLQPGEAWTGTSYRVVDDQRLELWADAIHSTRPLRLRLPPGDYKLLLERAGLLIQEVPFEVEDELTIVNLTQ